MAVVEATIISAIQKDAEEKIRKGAMDIPSDYSIGNALQSAWFILSEALTKDKKKVLDVCTPESIKFALGLMVKDGMNPAKHQCAFIPFGTKLTYLREYQGDIALAKRYSGVRSVASKVVYEGDNYDTFIGTDGIEKLKPTSRSLFQNSDKPIIGAWCVIVDCDGIEHLTQMTKQQIILSWDMNKQFESNESQRNKTQKNFEDQMMMKTVIKRACKPFINSSTDEYILSVYDEDETPRLQSPKSIRDILPEPKTLAIAPTDVKQIEAPVQQQSEEPVPDWGNVD